MAVEKWTPERRRQQTRTVLLDAAAQVFAQRGYHGASLDEIAETAGFTRGTIYKHFGNKDELFFAVLDHDIESNLRTFSEAFRDGRALANLDVAQLAETWLAIMGRDPNQLALNLEFRLYAMRNPDARAEFAAHLRKARHAVEQLLSELSDKAGVSFTVPVATLAGIVDAASQGFLEAANLDPADRALFESFIELLLPVVVAEANSAPARVDAIST